MGYSATIFYKKFSLFIEQSAVLRHRVFQKRKK